MAKNKSRKPKTANVETLERSTLHEAQLILRNGTEECHGIIDKLFKLTPQQQSAEYLDEFRKILAKMGETLFEAAKLFLLNVGDQPAFDFYFWPGYDHLQRDEKAETGYTTKRLTRHVKKKNQQEDPEACGWGRRETETESYDKNASSFWFNRLLGHKPIGANTDRLPCGTVFSPGSTHDWVTQRRHLPAIIYGKKKRVTVSLSVLCIQIEGYHQPDSLVEMGIKNWRVINLPKEAESVAAWGSIISADLNNQDEVDYDKSWPVAYEPESERVIYSPYDEEKTKVPGSAHAQRLWEKLYSLWVFCNDTPDWYNEKFNGLFIGLLKDLRDNGVSQFAAMIEKAWKQEAQNQNALPRKSAEADGHSYPYWYTIVLDETSPIPRMPANATKLGSAMILSSRPIQPEFFALAKEWIETIYLNMRYYESAAIIAEDGRNEQKRSFAHQTVDLIATAWLDPSLNSLKLHSRFSLWMAHRLLANVWGKIPFESTKEIHADRDADFPEWGKWSKEKITEVLIQQAFRHGLSRCTRPTEEKDDNAQKQRNRALARAQDILLSKEREIAKGEEISSSPNQEETTPLWFEMAKQQLRAKLNIVDLPKFVTYRGFVVAFHHCLWQAVHHAFLASVEEGDEHEGNSNGASGAKSAKKHRTDACLTLDWGKTSNTMEIYNASNTVLSKKSELRMPNFRPKDRIFLDQLLEKINPPKPENELFQIIGPIERTDQPGHWITEIKYLGG